MLRVTGHDAALLDGGLAAWDGPLETGPSPAAEPAPFTAVPWPDDRPGRGRRGGRRWPRRAGRVLDARGLDRFRGETEPVDARAGHIPGARNAHWHGNLDPSTGRFLAPDELRERFAALGVTDGDGVVAYCGSGVSACANLVALEAAGFAGARLYVASWSGWSADPDRPAVGPS